MAAVMCAQSVTAYEIFANQVKWKYFDTENKVKVEKERTGFPLHLDWNSRTFKDLWSNLLRTFKDHDFATDNVAIFAILLLQ